MINKKNIFTRIVLIVIVSLLIVSCGNSDDVVSGHFLQKRKYNKGIFVNLIKRDNKNNFFYREDDKKEIAISNKTDNMVSEDELTLSVIKDEPKKSEIFLLASVENKVLNLNNIYVEKNKPIDDYFTENKLRHNMNYIIQKNEDDNYIKTEKLGLIGVLVGLYSIFVQYGSVETAAIASFSFGAIAIILCIISIVKIKKNPEKYRRNNIFTYGGIILGAIAIIRGFIYLSQF